MPGSARDDLRRRILTELEIRVPGQPANAIVSFVNNTGCLVQMPVWMVREVLALYDDKAGLEEERARTHKAFSKIAAERDRLKRGAETPAARRKRLM